MSKKTWLLAAAVPVIAGSLAAAPAFRRGDDYRHLTAAVESGDIRDTVDATGTVNAVVNVQVGSQVSGTIAELDADFNSAVKKGEVLALIDPQRFRAELEQAEADLRSAEANVLAAEANVKKAEVQSTQLEADRRRFATLAERKLAAQGDLDAASAAAGAAAASVDAARASVLQAKAQVAQKRAAVTVAKTNLDYTVIRSPVDGVVVARNVDVGQTVAASLQAPTIFTIAQDLTKMLLYAKVDESDIGRIKRRQPVTFKVDAYPKEQFKGTVREVRMNPTMVQNVVTYDTVIEFENPDLKLFPGMTAYVTIPVASARGVVKIPNAALRYKPPLAAEEVRALAARRGIGETARLETVTETAVVWKVAPDGALDPVEVALGITDHTSTEVCRVLVGALAAGDEVVTSSVLAKALPPGALGIRR